MTGARQEARMLEAAMAELIAVNPHPYPFRCGSASVNVANALGHLRLLDKTGDRVNDWHVAETIRQLTRALLMLNDGVES